MILSSKLSISKSSKGLTDNEFPDSLQTSQLCVPLCIHKGKIRVKVHASKLILNFQIMAAHPSRQIIAQDETFAPDTVAGRVHGLIGFGTDEREATEVFVISQVTCDVFINLC